MTKALQLAYDYINMIELGYTVEYSEHMRMRKAALTALRAELAKPAQEPVQYQHKWRSDGEKCIKCGDKDWMGGGCSVPDTAQPAQEPLTDEQIEFGLNNNLEDPSDDEASAFYAGVRFAESYIRAGGKA